jgi:phospholipid transport system substrate-binding protein
MVALIGTGVLATAGAGAATASETTSQPQQVVGGLDGSLLDVMQNAKQLGFDGRYKKLLPVVNQVFDVRFMTQTAIGSAWSTLTPDQQSQLTDAFGKYVAATYAQRFDGYSGEKFVETGVRPAGNATLVSTQLVKSDGTPVKLDYVTSQQNGRWQVVDVYLTGTISEMATRRSEFSSVFRRSGYDGLLQMLQQKVAQLSSDSSVS